MQSSTLVATRGLSILISILLFFFISLNAQIKIKSRVEIKPGGNQIQYSLNSSGSLPPTSYIARYYSGTYLAWVFVAAKNSPPSEGLFSVAFRDKVRDTTMVFQLSDYINYRRSYIQGQEYDCCNRQPDRSCTPISETAYYAYSMDPELPIMIPYILKGDTLKFSYDNCTQPVKMDNGMEIQFAKRDEYTDRCYTYMESYLQESEICCMYLTPISYSVWQDADTLISGSSTMLYIYTPMDFGDDSLMTIEVDSAQYAKFIYDKGTRIDTLDSPMDSVKFSDAISGKIKFLAMGKQPDKPVPVAICARYMFDPSKVFEDTIVIKGSEILLGESKYYYATQSDNGDLTIHETLVPELPLSVPNIRHDDIWGNSPVEVVVTDPAKSGKKIGVYWEKKYPKYLGGTYIDMYDLPTGMIRLVGRYWDKDSIYTVKLSTTIGNAGLGIEVKKPASLGTSHATAQDVFGNLYNLDSVITNYAGEFGIPPQILKADMQQEGNFQPAYRWEPFFDLVHIQVAGIKYMDNNFRYKKTASSDGQPGIPTNHKNAYPFTYPQNDYRTIWEFFFEQSSTLNQAVISGANNDRYPKSEWYSSPAENWTKKYNEKYKALKKQKVNSSVATNGALGYANDWLKNKYWNGGMSKKIAQTRSAASYGLMQMLYSTAVDSRDYPFERTSGTQNHLPEYLNITDTNLTYAVPFLLNLIKEELGVQGDGGGKSYSWTLGLEGTIFVALNMYNGKTDTVATSKNPDTRYNWRYGQSVLNKVYQYEPIE